MTVLTAMLLAGIEGSSRPWCEVHCHEVQVQLDSYSLLAHQYSSKAHDMKKVASTAVHSDLQVCWV